MGSYITEIDQQLLKDAMETGDDVGAVLRSHFLMEVALIKVLEHKYPDYSKLNHSKAAQHLRAIRAVLIYHEALKEVEVQVRSALQVFDQVNKIRNEMAHSQKGIKTELTDRDVKFLYSQAAGISKNGKKLGEFDIRIGEERKGKLRTLPNRHQFVIISSMAASIIDIIPQQDARIQNLLRT